MPTRSQSSVPRPGSISAAVVGGWSLIAAALLFGAAFSYLAATFDYPDVLDRAAADVLPRLVALGATGRAVWAGYALLPLLLVPAGVGVLVAFGRRNPGAAHAALVFATLSAGSMMLGLSRWPSIQWELGRAWGSASIGQRESLAALSTGLNAWLGTFVGEFVGEACLNLFFLLFAWVLWRDPTRSRAWGILGLVVGGFGTIAQFRNALPAVEAVAEVNNLVLPLGLILLGVALLRSREQGDDPPSTASRGDASPRGQEQFVASGG